MPDKKFSCKQCNYFCTRNAHLQKHNTSNKHIMNSQPIPDDPDCKFQCKRCNKKYKGLSGLWQHNKKCLPVDEIPIAENVNTNDEFDTPVYASILVELRKLNEHNTLLSSLMLEEVKILRQNNDEVLSNNLRLINVLKSWVNNP